MDKKKITVLVNKSAGHESYVSFLSKRYDVTCVDCNESLDGIKIDLILFTGGEDVTPSYYNESKGKFTGNSESRDSLERDYMFHRRGLIDVPKLGICRGAQFLTVMNGGGLVQHVNGHATGELHYLDMKDFESYKDYKITSTHHQMMFPYNLPKEDYRIIATSTYFLSDTYLNGINQEKELPNDFEECEIVFYNKSKSLCIQGHPEMYNCPINTRNECLNIIETYLNL